ncbi:MAG: DUF4906 domain-containing protein [Bacteroidales bacterium]|nr:DUF4906 domain-containing protein [Bacteroidales bacterium]
MDRERVFGMLLTAALCLGCTEAIDEDDSMKRHKTATVTFRRDDMSPYGKTSLPDEERLGETGIMIFDDDGDRECSIRFSDGSAEVQLQTGKKYSVFAFSNLDSFPEAGSIEEMFRLKHRMKGPYDYSDGIPMTAFMEDMEVRGDTSVGLCLKRIMSKISIRIDRSDLSEDVEMNVQRIRIGNCPAEALLFRENRMEDAADAFEKGFERSDTEVLNSCDHEGLSGEICLYLLENMETERNLASYVEIEAEYLSDSLYCTDKPLVYRFCPGDIEGIERNCHYMITVSPMDDGLNENSWRVDKEGLHSFVQEIILSHQSLDFNYSGQSVRIDATLFPGHAYEKSVVWSSSDPSVATVEYGMVTSRGEGSCTISCMSLDGGGAKSSCHVTGRFEPPYFRSYPEDKYIRGDIGDTVRLWCEVFPPNAPFDVGKEYLEADKAEGIYDYIIDEDGHGVTLILEGAGSGLIYMEAGAPVNEAELYFIEVNLPQEDDSDSAQYAMPYSP